MQEKFDIIVVGGGPNGLVAAAYLARLGLKVLLCERHTETGGGLVTQEVCGFKLNHHATYMLLSELMPPVKDLRLEEWGVRFLKPQGQIAFLFRDGSALLCSRDPRETAASIGAFSSRDQERFLKMWEEFKAIFERILLPATYYPPLEPLVQMEKLQGSDEVGKRMAEISELTPLEVLDHYGFEHTRVRLGFLYMLAMFGLELDEAIGFLTPIYLLRLLDAALLQGGSHYLASVLRKLIEMHGGKVRTASPVEAFLLEGEELVGVRLQGGEKLYARAVISTLNPEQNFLELMREEEPPVPALSELRESVANWQWEPYSLFIAHRGVYGPPLQYPGYPQGVENYLNVVMGYEKEEDLHDHLALVKGGGFAPQGHGSCLSTHDPLLIPRHVPFYPHHLLRFETWGAYESDWSSPEKKRRAEACFALWSEYAPALKEQGKIVEVVWSPLDIEKHNPTMKRGSIKHGAYTSLQMGYNRPAPECSSYRTPLKNLYLAGSSTHPGGMVILGAGYNCARVVCEDLGIPWNFEDPPFLKEARERGYL